MVNLRKIVNIAKRIIGISLILFLIAVSFVNNLNYNINPFLKGVKYIPYMLSLTELEQLRETALPIYKVIEEINKKPEGSSFYFVPCFKDSGNTDIWWWYLYLLCRYYAFPKKVFCIDRYLYNESKVDYINRFIEGKESFDKVSWFSKRGIDYLIIYRYNRISIVSPDKRAIQCL